MRVRVWELVVALAALLAAVLEFAVGNAALGLECLSIGGVWLISRADVVAGVGFAGRAARFRARLGLAKLVALMLIYCAALAALFVVTRSDEKPTTVGMTAVCALFALAVFPVLELRRTDASTINWLKGGAADHVVCGPGDAYAVAVASAGPTCSAASLRKKLSVPGVTGVLCRLAPTAGERREGNDQLSLSAGTRA